MSGWCTVDGLEADRGGNSGGRGWDLSPFRRWSLRRPRELQLCRTCTVACRERISAALSPQIHTLGFLISTVVLGYDVAFPSGARHWSPYGPCPSAVGCSHPCLPSVISVPRHTSTAWPPVPAVFSLPSSLGVFLSSSDVSQLSVTERHCDTQ